jgi:hypothetical protein
MSAPLVAVLVGLGYALVLFIAIGLCMAAADGDRAAQILYRDDES